MRWREDFREILIVDQNCPILIQKAWRDHDTEGWAYLAAEYGEDALTWNVFRTLDPVKGGEGARVIQGFFGLDDPVEEVLFWGCDPDGTSEAQQILNILIRGLDGKRRGTMTEPDLVVITRGEVCFDECKLRPSQAPWAAKSLREKVPEDVREATEMLEDPERSELPPDDPHPGVIPGWKKRWSDYHGDPRLSGWLEPSPSARDEAVYQLIGNAIYSKLLAEALGMPRPKVVSLLSRRQFELIPETKDHYRRGAQAQAA